MTMTDGVVSGFFSPSLASTPPATHLGYQPDLATADPMIPADGRPGAFGRLVEIVRENDRLLAELEVLKSRVAEARSYLTGPRANPTLAHAYLDRERTKRSGVLARLRSNRVEIDRILGGPRRAAGAR